MSYTFVSASETRISSTGSGIISGAPFTVACWATVASHAGNNSLVMPVNTGDNQRWHFLSNITTGTCSFQAIGAASGVANSSAGTTNTNEWHHYAGVEYSTASRAAFFDGGNKGTDATSASPSAPNRLDIGARMLGGVTYGLGHNGNIAEVGLWDAALTDAEIASLAKGFSPALIRPASLIFYLPLVRTIQDTIGKITLSTNGSPAVAPHSRIILPSGAM